MWLFQPGEVIPQALGLVSSWTSVFGLSYESTAVTACEQFAGVLSPASAVHFPGSAEYESGIHHWLHNAGEESKCTVGQLSLSCLHCLVQEDAHQPSCEPCCGCLVNDIAEPGTAEDVAAVLGILKSTRAKFAIRSSGHATDVGLSSSKGVTVSMSRFNDMSVSSDGSEVAFGPGITWDQVYKKLAPLDRTVVGGRINGVGVAGFILGGGYSYHSNRYGNAIDHVKSFDLVLPNGTFVVVTPQNKDLWFGLRGGFNNFGIVTRFVMSTIPQGKVYGGLVLWTGDQIAAAIEGVSRYSLESKDVDAVVVAVVNGTAAFAGMLWYNGPEPPQGSFFGLESLPNTMSTLGVTSFTEYLDATSSVAASDPTNRGVLGTALLQGYSVSMINKLVNLSATLSAGGSKAFAPDGWASFAIEPFDRTNIIKPIDDAAWPRTEYTSPINMLWGWNGEEYDIAARQTLHEAGDEISAFAKAEGAPTDRMTYYPNYSPASADVAKIYGANVKKLEAIRNKYDPDGIMLQSAGFKFTKQPAYLKWIRRTFDL